MEPGTPETLTGQLTDAQIWYKPSEKLISFIKSMVIEENVKVPQGIASIRDNKHPDDDKPRDSITEYPKILQRSDIEYLNSLFADSDGLADSEESDRTKTSQNEEIPIEKGDFLVTFEDLLFLQSFVEERNEEQEEKVYFHQLFEGSRIILPKNKEIERNEELEARCVKLRHQQENRKYQAMTKNVDSIRQRMPEDTIAYQLKQINTQLIAVFQFVVSVLTGFTFGFIGIELFVGTLDFGFRLLLGIICALTVALAELYFLAKKLNEEADDEIALRQQNGQQQQSPLSSKDKRD